MTLRRKGRLFLDLLVHVSFLLREFFWVRSGFASEKMLPFACIVSCLGFWVALEHSLREEFATERQVVFLKEEMEQEIHGLREALLCIVPSGVVGRILLHFRQTQAERLQTMNHATLPNVSGNGLVAITAGALASTPDGNASAGDADGGQLDDMEIDIDDMPFAVIGVSVTASWTGTDGGGERDAGNSSAVALLLQLFCESGISKEFGNRVQVIQSSHEFIVLAGLSQDDGVDEHDERRAADVFRATSRLLSAAAVAAQTHYFCGGAPGGQTHRSENAGNLPKPAQNPRAHSPVHCESLPTAAARAHDEVGAGLGVGETLNGPTGVLPEISFRVVFDTSPMLGALIGTHMVRFSCFGEAVLAAVAVATMRSSRGASASGNLASSGPISSLLGENETAISRTFERCLALNLPVKVLMGLTDDGDESGIPATLSSERVCRAVHHVDPQQKIFATGDGHGRTQLGLSVPPNQNPVVVRCRPTLGYPRSYVVARQSLSLGNARK